MQDIRTLRLHLVQPPLDAQASGSRHKARSPGLPGGISPLRNLSPVLEHRAGDCANLMHLGLEFAEASGEETLVFTEKKRSVAALVSLTKVDRESIALSTNPEFLRIIETARQEIRAGKVASLEALEKKFGGAPPNKVPQRTRKPRRRPPDVG